MNGTGSRAALIPKGRTQKEQRARPIGHSVGRKVAADTSLWKCCNPDTSGGKWRRPLAITTIEPFADRSSQLGQHGLEPPPRIVGASRGHHLAWKLL
jgi:hypothetical protein